MFVPLKETYLNVFGFISVHNAFLVWFGHVLCGLKFDITRLFCIYSSNVNHDHFLNW